MEQNRIPKHIAIIMDGNGRWAKKRFMPRTVGHKEGSETLKKIVTHCTKIGVKFLTVYAFSTENWKRASAEVDALMLLFKLYLEKEKKTFMENDIRFMISGSRENISATLLKSMDSLIEETKENKTLTLNIAFNYGGRKEIVDGINKIISSGIKYITEEEMGGFLYNDVPDPELLIRTGGEFRISNFLLWQMAYSEIYISDKLWPDFGAEDLDLAIEEYVSRDRRYGGVKDVE